MVRIKNVSNIICEYIIKSDKEFFNFICKEDCGTVYIKYNIFYDCWYKDKFVYDYKNLEKVYMGE